MTNVTPKARKDLPEMEPMFQTVEAGMGFVPESMFTMATTLESEPRAFTTDNLSNWELGKHG